MQLEISDRVISPGWFRFSKSEMVRYRDEREDAESTTGNASRGVGIIPKGSAVVFDRALFRLKENFGAALDVPRSSSSAFSRDLSC